MDFHSTPTLVGLNEDTMSRLEDLPEDVHRTILTHVDRPDLHNLCLLNPTFDDLVSPVLLHKINIPWRKYRSSRSNTCSDPLPESFATGRLRRHARELKFTGGSWALKLPPTPTFPVVFDRLLEAVSTLSSLNALELEWDYEYERNDYTEVDANKMVCKVVTAIMIATHGQLKKLLIHTNSSYMHIPAPLHNVIGLEHFQYIQDQNSQICKPWVDEAIQRGTRHTCDPKCQKLPSGLPVILRNNSDIGILKIISGCLGIGNSSDNYLTPNLEKIHTFTLAGMSLLTLPTGSRLPLAPLKSLRHLSIKSRYSDHNLDLLWDSLREAGTELVTLEIGQVSSSLVDYLSSFSGLEKLIIRGIENLSQCVQGADKFFDVALPNHGSTLKVLELSCASGVKDVPQWAFHPDTWLGPLRHLHALEELRIHVSLAALPRRLSLKLSQQYTEQKLKVHQLRFMYQQLLDSLFPDAINGSAEPLTSRTLLPNLRKLAVCRPFYHFRSNGAARAHYKEEHNILMGTVVPVLRCHIPLEQLHIRLHHKLVLIFRPILESDETAKQIAKEKMEGKVREASWCDDGDEEIDISMKEWINGQFMFVPVAT